MATSQNFFASSSQSSSQNLYVSLFTQSSKSRVPVSSGLSNARLKNPLATQNSDEILLTALLAF